MKHSVKLTHAIRWAALLHIEQLDKSGEPYILHPLRVMGTLADETERIAAVLHDVVEDTSADLQHVEQAFGPEVGALVDALTKREGEAYFEYVARVIDAGPSAMRVKRADVMDNLRPGVTESLRKRYRKTLAMMDVGLNLLAG